VPSVDQTTSLRAPELPQEPGVFFPEDTRENAGVETKVKDHVRQDLFALCHRGLDVPGFAHAAIRQLRKAVPFDGCCWLTLDPATLLPTSHIPVNSLQPEDVPKLAENEFLADDVNKMAQLARASRHAGILREATEGVPERSPRYRGLLQPRGFEGELRATFVQGSSAWGALAMYRESGRDHFQRQEATFVGGLSRLLAEGVRRSILVAAPEIEGGRDDAPGLILLGPGNRVESVTPPAERWMKELFSPPQGALPQVVNAVAYRALLAARGGAEGLARTRVPTTSGVWLVLHGSVVGELDEGRTAVIIEPARPVEMAPLIADAYGLSGRERDITQLVVQGLSTDEIAKKLHLSAYTVQDYLKQVFEKVGVRSRRELVARVFFQQYAPRMQQQAPLAADGWFAEPA
jgi:DNA-binding CsgD family transcriptional regulator